MSEIDRRALFGAMGAGLVLAGCGEQKPDNAAGITVDMLGTNLSWEVNGATAQPVGKQKPVDRNNEPITRDFKPDFCCLVYMKFDNAKFSTRFAHFNLPATNQEVTSLLKDNFESMASSGVWAKSPSDPVLRQGINFFEWNFGHQHKIYIFLDNSGDIKFDRKNLILFSRFSARSKPNPDPEAGNSRARNNTFLNAKVDDKILWPGKEILFIENWYTDGNGDDISESGKIESYSMNIHLMMNCVDPGTATGVYWDVPIVIDPDPGNMGSAP